MQNQNVFQNNAFTKAGQVFSHEWRMRFQNLKLILMLTCLFFVVGLWIGTQVFPVSKWTLVDFFCLTYMPTWLKVHLWPLVQGFVSLFYDLSSAGKSTGKDLPFFLGRDVASFKTAFVDSQGRAMIVPSLLFLANPWVLSKILILKKIFLTAFGVAAFGFTGVSLFFKYRGNVMQQEVVLRGNKILTPRQARRRIKKEGASALEIAPGIPLLKAAESKHILAMGATGSGKTNCINLFLKQVREQRKRAVVLDTNMDYVNRFYDPSRGDVLLSPFEPDSVTWDLWADAKTPQDFDEFAAALIPAPEGSHNPFWHMNAREIVAVVAHKLQSHPERSLKLLVEYAGWKPLKEIRSFFKQTPLEALMASEGHAAETVQSIRAQMTDILKRLTILPDPNPPFSIRDFLTDPQKEGWLFLSTRFSDRSTLTPLLKFWVSLSIKALLSRSTENPPLTFLILDELFSLEGGTVAGLTTFLNEARKYGVCGVLGAQDLAGIQKIYGHEDLRTILTNCATKVIFPTRDPQSAKYISDFMGHQEVKEINESLSVGAHQMRDGVNMGSHRRFKPTVSADDIMSLPDLTAFIGMPKEIVTKATYDYLEN